MRLLPQNLNFDFLSKRLMAFIASLVLIIASIASLAMQGLELGIDFTGGTLIEIRFQQAPDLDKIREQLASAGFSQLTVQNFGSVNDILIRIAPQKQTSNADLSEKVIQQLKQAIHPELEVRRVEFVGPEVGDELTEDGGLAMLYALIGILIYVALRFEYRFALGSVVALIHDVIITLGVFSLTRIEFDLSVLAAILAVIGYSLNDTIVVFDRIRENFRKIRKGNSPTIINRSLNQTLSRTLMTSITTLLVLMALFFVGGESIHSFATALIIGVVVGTYSSIYIASSVILALGISKSDLMIPEKENVDADTSTV